MKTFVQILLFIFTLNSFIYAQCNVNIIGSDFAWCTPCEGTAYANATGGTAPYTYSWSTGDTTPFIDSLCVGNYIVTITDSLGCVAADSVTISQIGTPINVSISSTAASSPTTCDVCITVNISGGCVPYNLIWSSPSDPTWPPCSACPFETYNVTVTDACGCNVVDSITTDTVGTVGLETIAPKNSIDIYPNPSSEFLTIEVTNNSPTLIATITDINGNIVVTSKIDKKTTIIKTNELATGVYVIHIQDSEKIIQTKKWIKQ